MKLLLDTHAFLWLVSGDARLSATARKHFLNNDNELFLSSVSGFEIAIKHELGKLALSEPPATFIERRMQNNALQELPMRMVHTYGLAELPRHHRDPFDRLLIVQAIGEDLPILTADAAFAAYPVKTIW